MPVRRRIGRLALAGVVVLLLFAGLGTGHGPAARAPVTVLLTGRCPGDLAAPAPTGSVLVQGGPLPSGPAPNVTVEYSYYLETDVRLVYTSTVNVYSCTPETAEASTNRSGDFAFPSLLPATACNRDASRCTFYPGIFTPTALAPTLAVPVGYATTVADAGGTYSVRFVYDLASVSVTPGPPTYTAPPDAPAVFTAEALMGNGTASSLATTYTWSLSGVGWSFSSPPDGSQATVTATPGAAVGLLTVRADATVSGTNLTAAAAPVTLLVQATAIDLGALDRTSIDAGGTVAVDLLGVGAAGYAYRASVAPGLGLAAVPVPCLAGGIDAGVVNVSCAANLTYPDPGVAQPTASLTNGFSTAYWQFPDVTVDTAPRLSIGPAPLVGYAGAAVDLDLVAANGSGARPFVRACLAFVGTPVDCSSAPGPSWRFAPTFALPGLFAGEAWAVDADGGNGSIGFTVRIVAPLSVGPIGGANGTLSAGAPVTLSASIGGGDLPARYWWNVSGAYGCLGAGTATVDGSTSIELAPATAGSLTVSFVVVDALGTRAEAVRLLTVGPAPAVSLTPTELPTAVSIPAGTPFDVTWEALGRSGAPVPTFAAAAVLSIDRDGLGVAGWVNVSGLGPLPYLGNGSYGLPSSGWDDGGVRVAITIDSAGPVSIALRGVPLPEQSAPVQALVAPDDAQLKLLDPRVVEPGARANATFWEVEDRFGNPAVDAQVTVRLHFGVDSRTTVVAVGPTGSGAVGFWLNYTAPSSAGGNVSVLDAAGDVLLGPIVVPPAPRPAPVSATTVTIVASVPAGVAGAAAIGLVRRRSRGRPFAEVDDADLLRLAVGRDRAVALLGEHGPMSLEEMERAWSPSPAPVELADWLASLVADGSLTATVGADDRARFCLRDATPSRPRVTVDPDVLEEARRRRAASLDEDGPP